MPYSLIKIGYILILFGVIFTVLSLIPLYAVLPACAYWEERPNVAILQDTNQNIGFLVGGTYVRLDVYVSGGDQELSVQVLNVGLDAITNKELVDSSSSIAFEVPKNDYYSIYLRNDFSNYEKQVLIKVYYYFYFYIFLTLGIVTLGLGVIALILSSESKNRARKRLTSPPK
jgi:hypothetical protein